jgi:hypothetical protein
VQIQFRVRSNSLTGYKVQASASFSATTAAALDGGTTVDASDIGVGITSTIDGASVITPRNDIIATGLNYNPASISTVNGLTPYTGMGSGRATLADIIANPGITILSGPRVATTQSVTASGSNFITVTLTFGLLGQFFTPATLSGNLILVISNGP